MIRRFLLPKVPPRPHLRSVLRQYELVDRVLDYDPDADEALLNRAYVFSMQAHGSQKRASGDPSDQIYAREEARPGYESRGARAHAEEERCCRPLAPLSVSGRWRRHRRRCRDSARMRWGKKGSRKEE